MGGQAFKEKYEINRVEKQTINQILDIISRNFTNTEFAAVGNTENVMLENLNDTGDIDIIINMNKDDLFEKLDNIRACVDKKKLANNVLTVFSYGGKFYQVDFMTTTNVPLGKWLMKGNSNVNGVKGVMRNMLFCLLCKSASDICSKEGLIKTKFSLSFPGELRFVSNSVDGTVNKDVFISNEDQIRAIMRLSTNKSYEFNTFESVVDYLLEKNIYTYNDLLNSFNAYIEGSWVAKTLPEEKEKAIEYIKSKQI